MLRDTKVSSIYFTKVNAISGIEQWFKKIKYEATMSLSKKSLNVFKDKGQGFVTSH